MKKTKLLLPVFSVGAIAAAVVPFVTSCSDTYTLTWKAGDQIPAYDQMGPKQDIYTVEEATNDYFEQVDKKLLAQEIVYDDATTYPDAVKSVTVKAGLNKVYHTMTFTCDLEARVDGSKNTYHVECENVEFIAARLWGGDLTGDNIISPKILVYVKEAYMMQKEKYPVEEYRPVIQRALDYADQLSRDTSWSFLTKEYYEDTKETIITRISYSNIYEYVDNIFKDPQLEDIYPLLSLINFSIHSHYLGKLKIKATGEK